MSQTAQDRRAQPHAAPSFVIDHSGDGVLTITFSDTTCQALRNALAPVAYYEADETAVTARAMAAVVGAIGAYGLETLLKIAAGDLGEGVTVFDNLPFEAVSWSPAPGQPARSAKAGCLSEVLLLGFGGFLGEPYGVAAEGDRLIHELIPSQKDLERHTGNGSRKALGEHAENAALKFVGLGRDYSPKALMLTGVSAQEVGGPVTPVVIAQRALRRLSPGDLEILRAPSVYIRIPERWRAQAEGRLEVGPVSIVLGAEGREQVYVAFYGDMMRPADEAAAGALSRLGAAVEAQAVPLQVLPGRMVHLANGRVLHGRSDFEPEFDDVGRARRWLQRLFLTGRVEEFRGAEDPRERVYSLNRL